MILSLTIALKFHQSYRRNTMMSLVSVISIIGIIIGISVSIITLSVINGFEYELKNRILSIIPHGEIISVDTPFINWQSTLNKVKKIPNIIHADPYINFPGIIEFNNKWHLVYIKSINLINNRNIYNNNLINFIEKKSWQHFCKDKNQIILGKNISDNLNIKIGDWINILFVHDLNLTNKFLFPKKIQVQVSSILNLNSQFDENLAIISLSDAKNYCNNRISVHGIEIVVDDVFDMNQIIKKIKNELNDDHIQIYSWMDTYKYIYHDIQVIRLIIYLSLVLINGIACFNMIAILILSIKNKNYDIAILRALGARNIFIQYIFLWHGFIIYFISSIFGTSIGILISLNLTKISTQCFNIFGENFLPKGIYFIDFIPSKFHQLDVYMVLGIVFLFSLLISWYTLFKTNQIKSLNILK